MSDNPDRNIMKNNKFCSQLSTYFKLAILLCNCLADLALNYKSWIDYSHDLLMGTSSRFTPKSEEIAGTPFRISDLRNGTSELPPQQWSFSTDAKCPFPQLIGHLVMKTYWEVRVTAPPILTSVLHGGHCSASRPSSFNPAEKALSTHWIGSWVGRGAG
jgi:hypothetical protein